MSDLSLLADGNGPRLNWHPQVHSRFGEELSYFLIRLRNPRDTLSALKTLTDEAGIRAYCSYVVLGEHDGLLRIWMTRSLRRRFTRVLSRTDSAVATWKHFKAAEIYYLWPGEPLAGAPNLLDDSLVHAAALRRPSNGDRETVQRVALSPTAPDPIAVERLIQAGLLFAKPDETSAAVKAITFLESTAGAMPASDITQRLLRLADHPTVLASSLYVGEGDLAHHAFRFTVRRFQDVLLVTRAIDRELGPLPVRTTTLMLLETGAETDNINNVHDLNHVDNNMAEALDVTLEDIERLDPESRNRLRDLLELVNDVQHSVSSQVALGILRAAVKGDRLALRANLSFIVDFEYYFRQTVFAIYERCFDTIWVKKLLEDYEQHFRNVPDQDRADPDRWSLGVVHQSLISVAKDEAYVRGRAQAQLGEDWPKVTRGVLERRNDFAHGRYVRSIEDTRKLANTVWGDDLEMLLRGLLIFDRIAVEEEVEG